MAERAVKNKDLNEFTPGERHTVQVKFTRQIQKLAKEEPQHEFLTKWSKVHGRKERDEIIAKWAVNNYELNMEYFRAKMEQFEDTTGLSGETFPRQALIKMWGEELADTFIANCEALTHQFPDLVSHDPLLNCNVYMYSKTVVRAMRSTLDSVTSQSHASSGSRDNGSARTALPPMPAEEAEDKPPAGPVAEASASKRKDKEPTENVEEKPKRSKVVKQFKRKLAEVFASMPPDCDWQQIISEIMQDKTNNTN